MSKDIFDLHDMPRIPWDYCQCEYLEGQMCEYCLSQNGVVE
jgi:hypothetical protein